MEKRIVDREKYEMLEVNIVNGMPWPRLPTSISETVDVPLKEEYKLRSMDYRYTTSSSNFRKAS